MTYQDDFTVPTELLEQIATQGFDVLPELIRIVINAAMRAERQQHLGVAPYQHSPDRQGHANGYKSKTVKTRLGEITFDVPQVREGGFYPQALEKGLRSERAFNLTLAEMYVQGVSTRKVKAVVEQLCGSSVSSTLVSRAAALLDNTLEAWRSRPLGEMVYLFLDARYEKVRQDGQIRDAALLIAVGVERSGRRQVLGVSVSLGEHEIHWRTFLQSLVHRGLRGVQLITSDDHAGLKAARLAVFGGVPWQRCQFHLQQCQPVCAAPEFEGRSRCRSAHDLQCSPSRRGRCLSGPGGTKVRQNRFQTGRLDREKRARRLDRLFFPA
jgi:transposase-like protein